MILIYLAPFILISELANSNLFQKNCFTIENLHLPVFPSASRYVKQCYMVNLSSCKRKKNISNLQVTFYASQRSILEHKVGGSITPLINATFSRYLQSNFRV